MGLISSCKEGCTNTTAFNYSRTAKIDNGTCLYCDSTTTQDNPVNYYIQDYNSTSPFYQQSVIRLSMISSHIYYSGNGCKIQGHNNSNTCFSNNYNATFQNTTNKTVVFSANIPINQYGNNTTKYFYVNSVSISPYGSTSVYIGQGDCLNDSYYSISTISSSSIQYY